MIGNWSCPFMKSSRWRYTTCTAYLCFGQTHLANLSYHHLYSGLWIEEYSIYQITIKNVQMSQMCGLPTYRSFSLSVVLGTEHIYRNRRNSLVCSDYHFLWLFRWESVNRKLKLHWNHLHSFKQHICVIAVSHSVVTLILQHLSWCLWNHLIWSDGKLKEFCSFFSFYLYIPCYCSLFCHFLIIFQLHWSHQ